jgi:hypothetical protein
MEALIPMASSSKPKSFFVASIVVVGLVAAASTPSLRAGQQAPSRTVTFSKHIAPVLQRSCENCHRTNGVAPMPLTTYEEVRPWARSIKRKTGAREMPPWFIEKGIGIQSFKDDPSLTDAEIADIATWVDNGAPQGNPADMPPPRRYADASGWSIGTPDLIVSSPVMTVNARAADWHGEVGPTPTGLMEDRYVQAVEFKEVRVEGGPNQRVAGQEGDLSYFSIHHSGLHEVDPDGVIRTSSDGLGGGFYLVHELGDNPTIYPAETGVLLKGGSSFRYTMHTHAVGKDVKVRIDTAFKLHPKGWKPKYLQAGFVTMGQLRDEIDIPGNTDDVRVESYYRVPRHGILTTYEPHMHASGKRMCVAAIYPDGRNEMLNCAGYNHNWVKVYSYQDDVAPLLPAGTVLHIMGWYNNTSSNPRVVDPRNWKGWGNRSIDDMYHFTPRVTWLTEEQFKEKVAERERRKETIRTTAQANN